MSAWTRAEVLALLTKVEANLRRSEELRAELDALIERIARLHATEPDSVYGPAPPSSDVVAARSPGTTALNANALVTGLLLPPQDPSSAHG